ncbi:MAG: hypothetical protein COZ05_10265 [Armatimonadetes bacterium CG_4_10_14_3_um_filter_59_10]|nr:MAG: hypothetical protein COZ05_10265 [Armatimonadetes bacterium CG_4_10_14_3_um_filter_59_10]
MFLQGIEGAASGRTLSIPETGLSIGKQEDNDAVLEDSFVSRCHARIERMDGAIRLVDLNSTNGSFVNEIQIKEQVLCPGDRIRFGDSVFELHDRPLAVLSDESQVSAAQQTLATRIIRPSDLAPPLLEVKDDAFAKAMSTIAALAKSRPGVRPLEETLSEALKLLFEIIPADRGCILLLDTLDQPPTAQVVEYREGVSQTSSTFPLSRTLIRRAVEDESAVYIPDAMSEASLAGAASVFAHRLRCVAYVPLCFGSETVGVLCVDASKPGAIKESDLDVLIAFANHLAMVAHNARLEAMVRQELKLRNTLQRFMSRNVVDDLLARGGEPSLGGDELEISVLFADLRGFTSIAEQLSAKETVALLNRLFHCLTSVVFRHRGTLDKYIGDCVMALFGAPFRHEQHVVEAVLAGIDMQREIAQLKSKLADKYAGISIGVAINSGKVIVGNIGSEERMDYTAIGDVVNVAARLEDLAGPGQILITEEVARIADPFVEVKPYKTITLRGRQAETQVYAVTAVKTLNQSSALGTQ